MARSSTSEQLQAQQRLCQPHMCRPPAPPLAAMLCHAARTWRTGGGVLGAGVL